jgi:hypothetical protein
MQILSDDIDFSQYMRETDAQTKVKPASTWIGDIKDDLRNHSTERKILLRGHTLGWSKWTREKPSHQSSRFIPDGTR